MQSQTHDVLFGLETATKVFVEWDDGQPDREWACLRLLDEFAPGLAPHPISRGERSGRPFVTMQRLTGRPLGDGPLTARQSDALAESLTRMFTVPVEAAAARGLPERRRGPSQLAETLRRSMGPRPNLDDCIDPLVVQLALDAGAAQLAMEAPLPELTVVGIADLNPANVLWDGRVCRFVDFEDGGLSDPAFEVADYLEHLANRQARAYDAQALIAAMNMPATIEQRIDTYRPLFALFWLLLLLPGNRAFDRNPPGTTEAQARHLLEIQRTNRH
jgi:hypothetical protein